MNFKHDIDCDNTAEYIKNNLELKGRMIWKLIFAILIASIGLNINSTPVIIGAMLISPLMSFIIGISLALGTNDFHLLKIATKNLLIAVFVSVTTSTIYFILSPLSQMESEILARTNPTFYDVLIAIFGGIIAMISLLHKDKRNGTTMVGVAIATSLMPPLCTVGFGLATGHFNYFFGALYLFIINAVFICSSAYIVIKYIHFPEKTYLDSIEKVRMNRYMIIISFSVLIPSIFLAFMFINEIYFKDRAKQFINSEILTKNVFIKKQKLKYSIIENNEINLELVGELISKDNTFINLKNNMIKYKLKNTKLVIDQDSLYEGQVQNIKKNDSLQSNEINEIRLQLFNIQNELDKLTKKNDKKVLKKITKKR